MKKYKQPSTIGRFGEFGGMYVSETLMPPNSPNLPTVLGCLYVFINYKLMK